MYPRYGDTPFRALPVGGVMSITGLEQYLFEKHTMGIINLERIPGDLECIPGSLGSTGEPLTIKIIFTTTAATYFNLIREGIAEFWCGYWPFTVSAKTATTRLVVDISGSGENCNPDVELRFSVRY